MVTGAANTGQPIVEFLLGRKSQLQRPMGEKALRCKQTQDRPKKNILCSIHEISRRDKNISPKQNYLQPGKNQSNLSSLEYLIHNLHFQNNYNTNKNRKIAIQTNK